MIFDCMKIETDVFKKIEEEDTVPKKRRNEVVTTVLTLQLLSDILSLFSIQMAHTFSGLFSNLPTEAERERTNTERSKPE